MRSNEPCACKKDIPDGCLHSFWGVFFCKHTANAATTRDAKHSESVGMAYLQCDMSRTRSGIEVARCVPQKLSVSGVFLLSIIAFSCGETQKTLYRKQRVMVPGDGGNVI